MPHYNHDIAHCHKTDCTLYEMCYRGWLDRNANEHEFIYSTYFMPDKTGKDCEYFLNANNYG